MIDREETTLVAAASYKPMYLISTRGGGYQFASDQDEVSHKRRVAVDALFHYFLEEDGVCTEGAEQDLSQGEAIAKLITRKYHDGIYMDDTASVHEAPGWTKFRDEATFISGDIIDGTGNSIERWLAYHHGDDMVVIDGSQYNEDSVIGTPVPAFNRLMHLANNQTSFIEEGVIRLYPDDTRAALRFLNANPHDEIEGITYGQAKWLAEGCILANELVEIPAFQRNFNLLVIKGLARYIHANHINLNNLYRLMAKLGRTNTRLVFLG